MKKVPIPLLQVIQQAILLATWASLSSSCAGPASPLGAVWAVTPSQALKALLPQKDPEENTPHSDGAPKIRFSPSRQILHGPSPLRVIIEDSAISATAWVRGSTLSNRTIFKSKFIMMT